MRDDLISREYIKAFVCEYEKFNGKETEIVKAIPIQAIDNAPTLNDKAYAIGYAAGSREGYKKGFEDARPTGEWNRDINGWHVCSNCHMIYKGMPTIDRKPRWQYCPTCGAKMKEAEE